MVETARSPRIQEIDIAKGIACILMIAAHLLGGKLLPAGTFAAPLFFACSGMNTILLIEKTRKNKCYDFFQVLFSMILFFGGIIQSAIAHNGRLLIVPEFLQFIALAVLSVFVLSKLFKNPRYCGYLFPVPFLIQQLLPWSFLQSFNGYPLAFIFGGGFALFPWLGFVLFGVFILGLKKNLYLWLQTALSVAFVLSYAVGRIPLNKFWMSLTYILLALLVITLFFSLGRVVVKQGGKMFFKHLAEFFALPGRNSLMFIFIQYFFLRFFTSVNFVSSVYPMLLLETSYLFLFCGIFLKFYEKVKNETALFFPALTLGIVVAGLRWAALLKPRVDLSVADMVIGVLFAFLYVQLRRKVAGYCDRSQRK